MKRNICKLNSIKSKRIFKCIFSLLDKRKKLILLNYNKTLQYKIGVDIDDYKKETKTEKLGEKNGLGKEYIISSNILMFEGEFLNWKRNGKGKEYYENGEIKYKGEYLNGKRNGKGKEYYETGKIKFEGEYLKGDIIEGKKFDEKGKKIFELERNGRGIEFYDYGILKFEGDYLKGKRWNGNGYSYYGNETFELKNGKGYVLEYDSKGDLLFKGDYLEGKRSGKGKEYQNGKLMFQGNYTYGIRNGRGREYFDNLRLKFEGDYLNGIIWNGKGYDYQGIEVFEIKNGNGYLKEFTHKGNLIFEGEYLNGKRNGKGKEYKNDEIIFEGEYLNGKRNGKGKEYKINTIILEREYLNGIRNGIGKEYNYLNQHINGLKYEYGKEQIFDSLLTIYKLIQDSFESLLILYKSTFDNNSIFEGEYKKGNRWTGIVYDLYKHKLYDLINGIKIKDFKEFINAVEKNQLEETKVLGHPQFNKKYFKRKEKKIKRIDYKNDNFRIDKIKNK